MNDEPGTTPSLAWVADIESATLGNETFRTVLFTGAHSQVTVMSLRPGEDIGWEVHDDRDQFLRLEAGGARLDLGRTGDEVTERHDLVDDWAVVVPAGTWHNVVNTGDGDLKLYAIYAPAEHPSDTVHRTKEEADAAEAEHGH